MKIRFGLIALAMSASLPAFATSGYAYVGGEVGFVPHATMSAKVRADVLRELAHWKRNPVAAGWREVGGEAGWVFVGTTSTASRAEVIDSLMQARRSPVPIDGWLDVGGEAGAVYIGAGSHAERAEAARLASRPQVGRSAYQGR